MTHSYNLLIHSVFHDQINRVISSYPPSKKSQIENQITIALCEIKSNPMSGEKFRYITNEKLQGAIRKKYVGGREGHRLFYIFNSKENLVLPVYIYVEQRRDIDYKKVPWEEIADEIYKDFINKKYDKFVNWK